jgi:hypothetical protein
MHDHVMQAVCGAALPELELDPLAAEPLLTEPLPPPAFPELELPALLVPELLDPLCEPPPLPLDGAEDDPLLLAPLDGSPPPEEAELPLALGSTAFAL